MKKYFVISLILLLFTHTFYIGGLPSLFCVILTSDDTVYSNQYSYFNWIAISRGLKQSEAVKIIGKPLETWERNESVVWSYALSPSSTHHYVRQLYFDKQNNLIEKHSSYYWD